MSCCSLGAEMHAEPQQYSRLQCEASDSLSRLESKLISHAFTKYSVIDRQICYLNSTQS